MVLALCAGNPFAGGDAAAHEDEGITVIAVSVDVDENAYRQFIKNHNVNLVTVRDPSGKTNAAYGTFKFPESYIIDRKGIIQHKFLGAVDWTDQQVIDLLNSLSPPERRGRSEESEKGGGWQYDSENRGAARVYSGGNRRTHQQCKRDDR